VQTLKIPTPRQLQLKRRPSRELRVKLLLTLCLVQLELKPRRHRSVEVGYSGFSEATVRTAMSRLRKEGWLAERSPNYRRGQYLTVSEPSDSSVYSFGCWH
jgi:hypothetical protein